MSKDALTQARGFVTENIGEVTISPEGNSFFFPLNFKNTNFQALMNVKSERLTLAIVTPIAIPEGCMPDIMRAICLVNDGLTVGHFSLLCEGGLLEFIASTIFFEQLDDRAIDLLIKSSLATISYFYPAFLSIVFGNEDPDYAIRLARQGLE